MIINALLVCGLVMIPFTVLVQVSLKPYPDHHSCSVALVHDLVRGLPNTDGVEEVLVKMDQAWKER